MSVLDRIVEDTRDEVRRRRRAVPLAQLEALIERRAEGFRPFQEALTRDGVSLIAEHKRRSPSAGLIREGATVAEVVRAYERGGAAALSILTEPFHFGGSLDDLREARAASSLPVLRKDFVIDPYQLYEAAAAGADAILLIVAALELDQLDALLHEAGALDLDALVEVHDERELEAALEVEADVLGINNRDLSDFSVDVERTYELLADIPAGKTVVSESGFSTREQLDELERVGVDAVLIGETLMRASDMEAACRDLTGGGIPALNKVKICGITRAEDAELAAELGAWALGFILWPESKRAADPGVVAGITRSMHRRTDLVGVFVNQPLDEIERFADTLGLTHVQLHGDEGPSFCQAVAQRTGCRVIKAMRIGHAADLRELDRFHTDLHLLDTAADGMRGGTGKTWDWSLAAQRRSKIPFLLSGGLNPDNVAGAIAAVQPWGVDVASGVEAAPGVKDPARLEAFFAAVRSTAVVA